MYNQSNPSFWITQNKLYLKQNLCIPKLFPTYTAALYWERVDLSKDQFLFFSFQENPLTLWWLQFVVFCWYWDPALKVQVSFRSKLYLLGFVWALCWPLNTNTQKSTWCHVSPLKHIQRKYRRFNVCLSFLKLSLCEKAHKFWVVVWWTQVGPSLCMLHGLSGTNPKWLDAPEHKEQKCCWRSTRSWCFLFFWTIFRPLSRFPLS